VSSALETPRTSLSYVGARPYIRGADLFRWFERFARDSLDPHERPTRLRAFKAHREVQCDGCWRIGAVLEGAAALENASATLDFRDESGRTHSAAFVEDGARIVARTPDIAPRVLALEPDGAFAGRAELSASRSSADLLDALIEAYKALHVHTLKARGRSGDGIRFIYVEDLPWLPADGAPAQRATLRHLGQRAGDGRVYTLAAVTLAEPPALKLCYSHPA
jgi:hypothetical protein